MAKKPFEKPAREPLFHVVKRDTISMPRALLIRVVTVVVAILLCACLSPLIMGASPLEFLKTMFEGSFGSEFRIWKFAKNLAILLCISLAVTPAFRMRFWNIGAEGQVLIGALAATACAFYIKDAVPNWALLVIMFVAAVAVSSFWAWLPAIFKARWNTNETLFTLMMNYISQYAVGFALIVWNGRDSLPEQAYGHLPRLFDNEYLLPILVVAVLTVGLYVYLRHTKQGYEISVVGESENTAHYIGIPVGKIIRRTLLISGALCGIAAFLIVAALDHSVTANTVGGQGFTAIMVSWLAKFNPLIMIVTSGLIVFLDAGAAELANHFGTSVQGFPNVTVGIILFFIIGCEFFIHYRIKLRPRKGGNRT